MAPTFKNKQWEFWGGVGFQAALVFLADRSSLCRESSGPQQRLTQLCSQAGGGATLAR